MIAEVAKLRSLSFPAWLRLTVDDRPTRSNGWDLIFPNLWFHFYQTTLIHLPSNPMILNSLDPTVVIAPEFEGMVTTL
jgi:hypothetical protein